MSPHCVRGLQVAPYAIGVSPCGIVISSLGTGRSTFARELRLCRSYSSTYTALEQNVCGIRVLSPRFSTDRESNGMP
jgi:hypothetical protein